MKIITVSDSPNLFSGLARVHRHIIDGLVAANQAVLPCIWFGYDTAAKTDIALGNKPPELHYTAINGVDVQMIDIPKRSRDKREVAALHDIVNIAKPDTVITIGDYWDFYYMQAVKIKADFSFRWIACLTVEDEYVDEKLLPLFRYMDTIVVPTIFGKKTLERIASCPIKIAPYGVEPIFRRLSDKEIKDLKERRHCLGKTRFITVAQNTYRKNLPVLLQAIALLKNKDSLEKMQFYIHTNIDICDRQEGALYDLRKIAEKLGVRDMVSFPKDGSSIFSAMEDKELNDEYNASDFFVTPSTLEGWSLPTIEAMSCGLPLIANDASVMPEHAGELVAPGLCLRGWLAGNRIDVVPPSRFLKVVKPESLADSLYEAHQWNADPDKKGVLGRMRENCLDYAKGLKWDATKKTLCDMIGDSSKAAVPVEEI